MKKLVIIPTYNEIENIEKIIQAVFDLNADFHILIIDDGSPDGTGEMVQKIQERISSTSEEKESKKLHLIERMGKLGLGTAYITGFKWALEHDYDYIFEMDADFSHNPNDLLKLYEVCKNGADLAVGSRYLTGVNVVNWPLSRVLMSYLASKYVKIITGLNVHDTTAGFVCYKRKVLEILELDKIRFKGYAFQIEMKFTTAKCGFKIEEVPIVFVNRVRGVSKMNSGIFGEAFLGVVRLKIDSWTRKYPQKER